MNDISPLDNFNRILRFWWLALLAMLVGGLLGRASSFLLPPVYEATAMYNVQIDEEKALELAHRENPQAEMDFVTKNKYLGPVELVFFDPETRSDLEKLAQADGLDYSAANFNTTDFHVDRRGWDWSVTVRSPDANTAAELANLWVKASDARLQTLRQKAVDAAGLELQSRTIRDCFNGRALAEANSCAGTSFATLEDASRQMTTFDGQAQALRAESLGISDLVTLAPMSEAGIPTRAVLYRTSLVMLVGALLGLIAGAILVQRQPVKAG